MQVPLEQATSSVGFATLLAMVILILIASVWGED